MSICVISQRHHNYAEQIHRYKKKLVCEGKTFAHHPMRICVSVCIFSNLVHIGKIRYIKNIKNLPPGAMYSSACCPAQPRCFESPGQLKKNITLAARGLEELFFQLWFVSENNTMIDVTSLLHCGTVA